VRRQKHRQITVRRALSRLPSWLCLYSVLPNTLQAYYIRKETKRVTPISKLGVFAFFLKAHLSHSVRLRGAQPYLEAITGMGIKVDRILDREGQAMSAA
jgi:hypothetical protein